MCICIYTQIYDHYILYIWSVDRSPLKISRRIGSVQNTYRKGRTVRRETGHKHKQ